MKIEFISYDGAPPHLCEGKLVVKLDGVKTSFGHRFLWDFEKRSGKAPDYPRFWRSGGVGYIDERGNDNIFNDDWYLAYDEKDYPPEIVAALPELIKLFNRHVQRGCCGGWCDCD